MTVNYGYWNSCGLTKSVSIRSHHSCAAPSSYRPPGKDGSGQFRLCRSGVTIVLRSSDATWARNLSGESEGSGIDIVTDKGGCQVRFRCVLIGGRMNQTRLRTFQDPLPTLHNGMAFAATHYVIGMRQLLQVHVLLSDVQVAGRKSLSERG